MWIMVAAGTSGLDQEQERSDARNGFPESDGREKLLGRDRGTINRRKRCGHPVVTSAFPQGTVHDAGEDFQAAVTANRTIFALWEGLTPLGRNEFICWVDEAKQQNTRQRRIERTCEELLEGKRRPCCWAGCIHRTDKAPSRWQQAVLIDRKKNRSGVA